MKELHLFFMSNRQCMSRYDDYNDYDDDNYDDDVNKDSDDDDDDDYYSPTSWERFPDETDEDYRDRMEDQNSFLGN